ncbi:MAG: methionine--tRNA ligase [Omnitrophica bacterium RIFCSPLOWO2_12_FULL_44_17]|uniref:Methionine--tRNA ligase n=1 Tax=Candidatus Danuiimicrobium aquiferis TaxID=1801832 RepID=A0A1G1L032_9BACT|nr:MAG: methionine--tRNA ligase [Omnitrophica bacterium RIFCSPHIGHO2_02_FULL_45_28]OGW88997.1 MAG: methionine--tRNA ligase [Omnitrophica bacterium RIFCSPHIGHO2_12_FULL_44_12]OGW98508.1 MAG: methionine--tRNA ligase [Omnitrophica bacterium RIFCSPLOWO2_12_FULL_44_17]OGX05060.1 MAG: methionine--tRNA ligase [Omnitrophica bacterium RIFCSPLOWO2_02_FULL_44_11]
MKKPYYITTPIYYVNASPHIGHAYTTVLCDTFARFHRFMGEETFYLTGTDEHGAKVEKAAREQGKDPKTYVDGIVPRFKDLWKLLGIEYDYFIRTTDENHQRTVQNILRDLEAKGDIYTSKYKGWYCVPCESFWTKLQLVDGKCPDCHREVQELEEENYFFKMAKYQTWLMDYIENHPGFVRPEIRRNEILGFLKEPLEDLCITRPRTRLGWGIDYPNSKDHVIYVWFDALINYVSAIGYTIDDKKFNRYWPVDAHMIGKDILRQHAVYWPIMLKAMGVEMPKMVLAHGWWTMGGAKVSKSRGNTVDPVELVKKYGIDAFRYFLLREVTLGLDGAFSEDLLAERYTSDLANDLGNLWFRLASMLGKYFEGKIPACAGDALLSSEKPNLVNLYHNVESAMLDYDPRSAVSYIWAAITRLNGAIEYNKPWVLAKDPAKREELARFLVMLGEWLAHTAVLLLPFLPHTAQQILERFKLKTDWTIENEDDFGALFLKAGTPVERGDALFPRLEEMK